MNDNGILSQEEIEALLRGDFPEESPGEKGAPAPPPQPPPPPGEKVPAGSPPPTRTMKGGKKAGGRPITEKEKLDLIMDIPLEISVIMGEKKMTVNELLELRSGTLIELKKLVDEPVDIYVKGKLLARGVIISIDENFGVRLTQIIKPVDRLRNLR